ncbi:MAG: hypothetical protein LBS15_00580 [Endomicrobium sp.]|jgi:hypothetical protein|nr:hypothetical protein [Endomicrobium sp.]
MNDAITSALQIYKKHRKICVKNKNCKENLISDRITINSSTAHKMFYGGGL